MATKYFKRKSDGAIYYEGKDHKRQLNLINAKSGSEYFLPGYYAESQDKIKECFKPVTLGEVLKAIPEPYFAIPKGSIIGNEEFEILEYKEGNWFINVGTVGNNNGKPNQSYYLCVNANIKAVKRNSDGKVFYADGQKYETKTRPFYITHLWYNSSLNTISIGGYYTKKNMTNRDYFSANICSLKDLI